MGEGPTLVFFDTISHVASELVRVYYRDAISVIEDSFDFDLGKNQFGSDTVSATTNY